MNAPGLHPSSLEERGELSRNQSHLEEGESYQEAKSLERPIFSTRGWATSRPAAAPGNWADYFKCAVEQRRFPTFPAVPCTLKRLANAYLARFIEVRSKRVTEDGAWFLFRPMVSASAARFLMRGIIAAVRVLHETPVHSEVVNTSNQRHAALNMACGIHSTRPPCRAE
jgi:hypothetical protein